MDRLVELAYKKLLVCALSVYIVLRCLLILWDFVTSVWCILFLSNADAHLCKIHKLTACIIILFIVGLRRWNYLKIG